MPDIAPFPVDPELTAVAIGFHNPAYIADLILPRVPVGKMKFKWNRYPVEQGFIIPDAKVGRRSAPNEITLSATEETDTCEDYGLEDPIPQVDIDEATGTNFDPRKRSVMQLADYIALGREKRVADMVFDPAMYPDANKMALVGNDQFSDFANSDPVAVITEKLDEPLVRPTSVAMGQAVWSKVSRHPKIVKAINGNEGDTGIVRRQAFAELFELEEVLIGKHRFSTARKGQPPVLQRVWGPHMLFFYKNKLATPDTGFSFGMTAQYKGWVAGQKPDGNIGLRGGVRVRAGETLKEVINAPQAAFLIEDAVAG